jgi:hypothetical protein
LFWEAPVHFPAAEYSRSVFLHHLFFEEKDFSHHFFQRFLYFIYTTLNTILKIHLPNAINPSAIDKTFHKKYVVLQKKPRRVLLLARNIARGMNFSKMRNDNGCQRYF